MLFFGRIAYNWQDTYLLNLTARRDGSSRFGPKSQFHNFGAIGAGWIFSNQKLFKEEVHFISFGKIREVMVLRVVIRSEIMNF